MKSLSLTMTSLCQNFMNYHTSKQIFAMLATVKILKPIYLGLLSPYMIVMHLYYTINLTDICMNLDMDSVIYLLFMS